MLRARSARNIKGFRKMARILILYKIHKEEEGDDVPLFFFMDSGRQFASHQT